jgi:hypothetical protein
MDHFEQQVALKFLFLRGLRYKAAHRALSSVLGEQAYSLSQAKRWICQFKDRDLSSEDDDRSGRPFSDIRMESNQNYFLAPTAPELSKENSISKRRVDKKELIVHMDNSISHNRCMI